MIGRRKEQRGNAYGASFLELFFDLVFVFAITQISHLLLDDLSWVGAAKSAIALLAVWWAWNYTTWVTNELDVDAVSVRLTMLALMLAGLLMAIAIPEAFGERALLVVGLLAVGLIGVAGAQAMVIGGLLAAVLVGLVVGDHRAFSRQNREGAEAT